MCVIHTETVFNVLAEQFIGFPLKTPDKQLRLGTLMSRKIKELFSRTKEQGISMTVYNEIVNGQLR